MYYEKLSEIPAFQPGRIWKAGNPDRHQKASSLKDFIPNQSVVLIFLINGKGVKKYLSLKRLIEFSNSFHRSKIVSKNLVIAEEETNWWRLYTLKPTQLMCFSLTFSKSSQISKWSFGLTFIHLIKKVVIRRVAF